MRAIPQVWTLVLAAGSGRRLSGVTGGVPKQFWRGPWGSSLLDDTLIRFRALAPINRTVVVVDESHRRFVLQPGGDHEGPEFVFQPGDRGTAIGLLLGLASLPPEAADDVVIVTPADHGIADEALLAWNLRHAIRHVSLTDSVVLCGVEPDDAVADYGWIVTERTPGRVRFKPVQSFVEKPGPVEAARLRATGAVWNTMVIVSRVTTLWNLCSAYAGDAADMFDRAALLSEPDRQRWFAAMYPSLPPIDLSRQILARAIGLMACVWPASVGWSDLGTPERLRMFAIPGRRAVCV